MSFAGGGVGLPVRPDATLPFSRSRPCARFACSARASFHVYNSRDEVDRLVAALGKAREVFGL